VLNDEYYSFPQWSEDTVFQNSKKNPHEEVLFRCEDERYDLDMIIEANLSTIRLLEPLAKRLATVSQEEQAKFKLTPSLGGQSEVIPLRAIRKVYGDRAGEVMDGLKRFPAVALPIVLNRLRQKDEEWRRAQREWNKIWRDTHAKNYYRALDYQGAFLKQAEKKAKPERSFLAEAEQAAAERRAAEKSGTATRKHDTEVTLKDLSVLKDVMEIVTAHCDKTAQAATEKAKVQALFSDVLHRVFGMEKPTANGLAGSTNAAAVPNATEQVDKAMEVDVAASTVPAASIPAASAPMVVEAAAGSAPGAVSAPAAATVSTTLPTFKGTGKAVLYGNLHFYLIFRFLSVSLALFLSDDPLSHRLCLRLCCLPCNPRLCSRGLRKSRRRRYRPRRTVRSIPRARPLPRRWSCIPRLPVSSVRFRSRSSLVGVLIIMLIFLSFFFFAHHLSLASRTSSRLLPVHCRSVPQVSAERDGSELV
jgi:hypothetical protein